MKIMIEGSDQEVIAVLRAIVLKMPDGNSYNFITKDDELGKFEDIIRCAKSRLAQL